MESTFSAYLLPLSILVPLAAALLLFLAARLSAGWIRTVAGVAFAFPLLSAVWLTLGFSAAEAGAGGYRFVTRFSTGLDDFGIALHFGLNGIGLPLYLLAGIVGFAAGLFAITHTRERIRGYLGLLLFMHAGLMGIFCSIDVFFFYFFHELALIPTFIMIGIWGGTLRRVAAMEMTIYLTLGALLSLAGLIALYVTSGAESFDFISLREALAEQPLAATLQSNIFALLLFGFGILVSLFPFHSWAPRGYAAAPTAVAMLHAGVLKKFGLYGLIQIAAPLLPTGAGQWMGVLAVLALGNLLVIGLVCLVQRNLKELIGYSSVMHMGLCFLGIVTLGTIGVGGAVVLMFAHGLSVALLFMLAQCIFQRSRTFEMRDMGGLAVHTPLLSGFFIAAIFANIGLPGFANFWGEFVVYLSLWQTSPLLLFASALGIIITAIYGLRAVARIFYGEPSDWIRERAEKGLIKDLGVVERVPAVVLLAGLLLVGIYPKVITDDLNADLEDYYPLPPPQVFVLSPEERGDSPRMEGTLEPKFAGWDAATRKAGSIGRQVASASDDEPAIPIRGN